MQDNTYMISICKAVSTIYTHLAASASSLPGKESESI